MASANPLDAFYEGIHNRRVDLIGLVTPPQILFLKFLLTLFISDYAGNELFLIEGDSLLLQCFVDEKLDFNGKHSMLQICVIGHFGSSLRYDVRKRLVL
jgi:hypothetical protein